MPVLVMGIETLVVTGMWFDHLWVYTNLAVDSYGIIVHLHTLPIS